VAGIISGRRAADKVEKKAEVEPGFPRGLKKGGWAVIPGRLFSCYTRTQLMHRILCGIAALAMMAAAVSGATTPASKKKAPVAQKKPLTALQKSVANKRAVTSASSKKKTPVIPAVTWRNRQLQPSEDRYKEIQTALASKGYLQPEQATGAWDQNSADAMKQFQSDQNLDASGKINSLSLIALGLGPKHDAAPAQVAPPAEQR
jgi:hypothetical protein